MHCVSSYPSQPNEQFLDTITEYVRNGFVTGFSTHENGFTASLISEGILSLLSKHQAVKNIILSGGGRKNEYLIKKIKENVPTNLSFELIDKYEINGDFVESQAFAFFAIRTYPNFIY